MKLFVFLFFLIEYNFHKFILKRHVFALQVRTFYNQVLKADERQRLCENMAGALKGAQLFIQKRMVSVRACVCCFKLC